MCIAYFEGRPTDKVGAETRLGNLLNCALENTKAHNVHFTPLTWACDNNAIASYGTDPRSQNVYFLSSLAQRDENQVRLGCCWILLEYGETSPSSFPIVAV